jgi:hypothetical protein
MTPTMKSTLNSPRPDHRLQAPGLVAQVSQPAVSPISQSGPPQATHSPQVWKLAIQQTWKYALLGLALLLGALGAARADTLTVVNLDDSGPGSLRQAIADATPGDTIDFAVTGTITLTSGELVITNDLTISGPGPNGTHD